MVDTIYTMTPYTEVETALETQIASWISSSELIPIMI